MQVELVLGSKRVLLGNEDPRSIWHPEIFQEGRQPQGILSRWWERKEFHLVKLMYLTHIEHSTCIARNDTGSVCIWAPEFASWFCHFPGWQFRTNYLILSKPLTLEEHFKGFIETTGKKCFFYRSEGTTSQTSRTGERWRRNSHTGLSDSKALVLAIAIPCREERRVSQAGVLGVCSCRSFLLSSGPSPTALPFLTP